MRIYEKTLITISTDELSNPKEIKFQTDSTSEDLLSCNEVKSADDIFPVATTAVSMGNITNGKFIYAKPTLDCTLVLSGENVALRAGKASKIWANFTSVSIIEAVAPNAIELVIAGD